MLSNQSTDQVIKQWCIDLLSLMIFLGLFYALWIGSYALFTPDEGRYSEIAREMIVTHDYVTPRLNGVVFLDKPIFYYWLQASAIKLFGLKEWALRFWPAFAGILCALMTYVAGRILFNRRTGFISALILATCPLFYGAAHYANLDLEVATFVSISLLSFITAMKVTSNTLRNTFLITAYIFAGIAMLTKGLIGIAFPAMIIGSWILLSNRWHTFKTMRLVSGLLLFFAITIPWYVLVQKANPEFFQFFFMKQQVSRFLTTETFNNQTPMWFYIPIVLAGMFPWCIFIIQALSFNIKSVWKDRKNHPVELFLLLWFIIIFCFFSFPKSKTVGYILPIFPTISLLMGNYLSQCWENTKGIRFGFIAFIMLCIGIVMSSLVLPHTQVTSLSSDMIPYLNINAAIFFISGIVMLFLLRKKHMSVLFSALVITAMVFLLTLSASCKTINQKSIKPLALHIKPQLMPNDEIVAYYKYFQDLPIYLERRITIVADWNAKDIPFNDNWVRELWYGMPYQNTKPWLIDEDTFWQRWNSNKHLYVFTDVNYYNDLKEKSKKKIYKIDEHDRTVLLSNQPV